MHLTCLEIANFRKLLSVRIDLADTTTLLVGANNSGKTSAMLALRRFLVEGGKGFRVHDFTLCHWKAINELGLRWAKKRDNNEPINPDGDDWTALLPTLDLWFNVPPGQMHFAAKAIPTLDWTGGSLGIRMRLEPTDRAALVKDYLTAIDAAASLKAALDAKLATEAEEGKEAQPTKLTLWPKDLVDFLDRRLASYFGIQIYTLDPDKLVDPENGQAVPQELAAGQLPLDENPLSGLIRVDEINAQRGLGEQSSQTDRGLASIRPERARLSDQFQAYYSRHLDPTDNPDVEDLSALQAMEAAQDVFDQRLAESFASPISEMEGMNYPGVTDPKIRVSTKVRAVDGLDHDAAVSFEVDVVGEDGEVVPILRLPEASNGLGYQNLISMVFRLMSFRDHWMRIGKAGKSNASDLIEPIHLVLIEEPEAHLHAQVQQVFIKKAFAVLRGHPDLGDKDDLRTQLIVSTHSSHVAHQTPFKCLRYFRRLPAGMAASVPVSAVVNLRTVFGEDHETERFVTRYLRSYHADLLFADAAILVEGPAEYIILPNFIRKGYEFLNQCYISLLEIGGSHAHRLRPLIEHLGLTTLLITDLDAGLDGKAVQTTRAVGQTTNNVTLTTWLPKLDKVDELLEAAETAKIEEIDPIFAVRVAYQTPIQIAGKEALPTTFEDALAFENIDLFKTLPGKGLVAKFRAATAETEPEKIGAALFDALRNGKKAELALDIIGAEKFEDMRVPAYIAEGLDWLTGRLKKKQVEVVAAPKNEGEGHA